MSNLTPIFYEIEQYIEASIHNTSLLRRGARVSGALQSDNNLTDEQFMRLQEQVNNFYSGSDNAGRPLLLEAGMNFTEMSMNNKDMDFLELKKNVTYMIYNALKIPLPLISPEHSTLSNMEIAKLNLYDNAILPIARRIYTELSIFLLPRYRKDNELTRYRLSYSPGEITALEPRRNDELNKLNELGILTINELRAKIGYEPLEGGDNVLSRFNQTTVATDQYTEDQPERPVPRNQKEFIESLKKHRNEKGVRIYSDNFIDRLMKRYGN
jgi:HK97 family phage portal protein